jgi:hypothetical protein
MDSLARLGDVPTMKATQRESLVAFLGGVDRLISRLVDTFAQDVRGLPESRQRKAAKVFARAEKLRANIADELAFLNDYAQGGSAWWRERIENGRIIANLTGELSDDMIGLLENGTLPSETKARNEMIAFVAVAAAIAGGIYLWWRSRQGALGSYEDLEGCGCSLGG